MTSNELTVFDWQMWQIYIATDRIVIAQGDGCKNIQSDSLFMISNNCLTNVSALLTCLGCRVRGRGSCSVPGATASAHCPGTRRHQTACSSCSRTSPRCSQTGGCPCGRTGSSSPPGSWFLSTPGYCHDPVIGSSHSPATVIVNKE